MSVLGLRSLQSYVLLHANSSESVLNKRRKMPPLKDKTAPSIKEEKCLPQKTRSMYKSDGIWYNSAVREIEAEIMAGIIGGVDLSKKKIVVSLGHEALGYTTQEQWDAVKVTARALADIVEADYQLTITHSNGPQVSMIHKAMTELRRIYTDYTPAPMCVCNAMSQGYVGYDIQNALRAELLMRGISTPVSTILTQVSVDPYDEAFYEPTKIIGRVMTKAEADIEIEKGNYVTEVEGEGYRRVVAAPKPLDIMEIETIRTLADNNQVVIACGGGGIPVIVQKEALRGASAVIEKDSIAGKLAADLKADRLFIFTSVKHVYKNYRKENETPIHHMTVSEAQEYIKEGQFEEGTMLPKIEAAIEYLTKVPSGLVIITSLDFADEALKGSAGTVITA